MKHSMKFSVIHPHGGKCARSSVYGGGKIASELLTYPSLRAVNNTERSAPRVLSTEFLIAIKSVNTSIWQLVTVIN